MQRKLGSRRADVNADSCAIIRAFVKSWCRIKGFFIVSQIGIG